jgi:hypothetical protein
MYMVIYIQNTLYTTVCINVNNTQKEYSIERGPLFFAVVFMGPPSQLTQRACPLPFSLSFFSL